MSILRPRFVLSAACAAVLFACSSKDPANDAPDVVQGDCNAPLGWWESKGLEPLFQDPNGSAPSTNCDFQVWAWTAFVHWTQIDAASGQPQFLGLPTVADFTTPAPTGPRRLQLKPRTRKPERSSEITQALSNGVIVDQRGRIVYYSTHMDPIYFAFAAKYYGVEKFNAAPATLNFPIGATVLKAAWRVVEPGENTNKMFTTPAELAKLENQDGIAVASSTMIPATVALVGLHVVGVTKDHPESVWATFEQDDNAPNLPPGVSPTSSDPVSAKAFQFYKAGTMAKACNAVDTKGNPLPVTVEDEAAQVCAPLTDIFRQFQFGGAVPADVKNIQASNISFRAGIRDHASATVNAVFANYFLVGTVWQKPNSLKPGDGSMDATAVGSKSLANSTLETFEQQGNRNCFSCHETSAFPKAKIPAKNIGLSHVLYAPFFAKK